MHQHSWLICWERNTSVQREKIADSHDVLRFLEKSFRSLSWIHHSKSVSFPIFTTSPRGSRISVIFTISRCTAKSWVPLRLFRTHRGTVIGVEELHCLVARDVVCWSTGQRMLVQGCAFLAKKTFETNQQIYADTGIPDTTNTRRQTCSAKFLHDVFVRVVLLPWLSVAEQVVPSSNGVGWGLIFRRLPLFMPHLWISLG